MKKKQTFMSPFKFWYLVLVFNVLCYLFLFVVVVLVLLMRRGVAGPSLGPYVGMDRCPSWEAALWMLRVVVLSVVPHTRLGHGETSKTGGVHKLLAAAAICLLTLRAVLPPAAYTHKQVLMLALLTTQCRL